MLAAGDLKRRLVTVLPLIFTVVPLVMWSSLATDIVVGFVGLLAIRELETMLTGSTLRRDTINLAGTAYIMAAALSVAMIRAQYGPGGLMFVLIVAFIGDVAAYLGGKTFGSHQLTRISPHKTWEGAICGLAGSMLAVLIANISFHHARMFGRIGWGRGALIAAAGALAGQLGDLLESGLKRRAGVKDSGKLLPGHGGILDRVDALLAVAMLSLCLFKLMRV